MPKFIDMLTVSQLYIYPIKGIAGIQCTEAIVTPKGLAWDRRFMLVDQQGQFITQREHPELTQFMPEIKGQELHIRLRQISDSVTIQTPHTYARAMMVWVWGAHVKARLVSNQVDQWFSEHLKKQVHLVYMPDTSRRSVPPEYAGQGQTVSFADAYPFLIATEASLQDLNSRLTTPVPMDRFRPNIVIAGDTPPWQDDHWRDVQIGSLQMRCVKPCARCIVITTDQTTGLRSKEPLATLSTFRKVGNKVLFGQNTILVDKTQGGALLRVGDAVQVQ
jgi:uncharacterized protein